MGIESHDDAVRALKHIKEDLKINPEIVVHDLSPNLISATSEVFGEEKVALDPFHVMQDLNRAILKDLRHFSHQRFLDEKKELDILKTHITQVQKGTTSMASKDFQYLLKNIPDTHPSARRCAIITDQVLKIHRINQIDDFYSALRPALETFRNSAFILERAFGLSVAEKLPKYLETAKSMHRIKTELLKKLKTLYRESQRPLKDAKRVFNKVRWAIFYQSNHLTPKRARILITLLTKYPELSTYRELTLAIGSIYRLPNILVNPLIITDLPINPKWGNDLKACLTTLKHNVGAVVRFRTFYANHPNAPRKCRANMEYKNRKVRRIFGSGNYMKKMNRIENEMKMHLGGEIRNLLRCV